MFLAALASVLFALILIAYWRKLVLQFMYLNLKAHEKQASQWKFLSTKLPKEIAERRSQAILLFPFSTVLAEKMKDTNSMLSKTEFEIFISQSILHLALLLYWA